VSIVQPASELPAGADVDLFEAYREGDGVVLQFGRQGFAASGDSQAIEVAAGPHHVRRAAALVRAALEGRAGGIAMGALPYDGSCVTVIRLPERVIRSVSMHSQTAPHPDWAIRSLVPDPLPVEYEAAVERALAAIDTGVVEKVVLARTLLVAADSPIDARLVARRLHAEEPGAFVFLVALPGGASSLVGASPELVVRRRGRKVFSDPLAGTARRSRDRTRDREIAQQLLDAVKERREHRLVVEAVSDALTPFCSNLVVDSEPSVTSTATLWHLHTAIKGTLKTDAPDALTIAAALHPTPAVCGTPQAAAAQLISRLEPFDRRFFAGMVGWVDALGDGEWALTLRCAEVSGSTARLHAGAGIVAGSKPALEDLETEAKFSVGLRALGVEPVQT
jgi:isochorismate synthase